MLNKELVLAALAAAMLTVGTASATTAAGCMETCAEEVGDYLYDTEDDTLYELGSCTETADRSGSTITCTYNEV